MGRALAGGGACQASIAGLVKDATGAVLPGVTVEASSPALIEKVRTAVSDGTGQYRICRPELSPTVPYCHVDPQMVTRVTGLGSYLVPKIDVQLSATLRSDQGGVLAANYAVPTAVVAQSLGRNLAGNNANATVNLIEPGRLYGDRINELDIRVAKILRFGRTRSNVGIDVYNILNSSAVLTYNQAFNPTVAAGSGSSAWLAPTAVLTPRFIKISVQVDF